MKIRSADQLKVMLLLLALGLADSPAIAEPEPRRLLDKDHLKGDFGPDPTDLKQGGVIHSQHGPVLNWPNLPGKNGIPAKFREPNRQMWGDFGPYTHQAIPNQGPLVQNGQLHKRTGPPNQRKIATDIHHLKKAKDGRWLFNSIEDEKLFLLLPREKVKKLLGVPRKDTGGLIEYNCRVKDSPGYLELFIGDELVQSSKIWLEDTYGQSKRKK